MDFEDIKNMNKKEFEQFMFNVQRSNKKFCVRCGNFTLDRITIYVAKNGKTPGKLCNMCNNCYSSMLDYLGIGDIEKQEEEMNREIKFRGKSEDEWVYGMLLKVNEGDTEHGEPYNYLIQTDEKEYGEYVKCFITNNNTIGQFTGLHDKNGKEIYEGDIILTQPLKDKPFSSKAKSKKLKGIVRYNIECGKNFISEPDKIKYWGAKWDIEIIDKKDYEKYHNYGWGLFFECEVIRKRIRK